MSKSAQLGPAAIAQTNRLDRDPLEFTGGARLAGS
jgi:hypothetical protein